MQTVVRNLTKKHLQITVFRNEITEQKFNFDELNIVMVHNIEEKFHNDIFCLTSTLILHQLKLIIL